MDNNHRESTHLFFNYRINTAYMKNISFNVIKRFTIECLQLALIVLRFNWCFKTVNWVKFIETITTISFPLFLIVLIHRFLPWIFLGFRLHSLFGNKLDIVDGIKASLLCVGLNSILPSRAGDIAKVGWLKMNSGIAFYDLLGGIFIERLLDVSILSIALLSVLYTLSLYEYALFLLFLAFLMWLALIFVRYESKLILSVVSYIKSKSIFHWFAHVLLKIKNKLVKEILLKLLGYSVCIWLMNFLHVLLVIMLLTNLELSLYEIFVVFVAVFASSAFGVVPGGIGVMESAVIYVSTEVIHLDMTYALVLATFFRFFYSVPSILSASIVMLTSKIKFRVQH